LNSIVADEVSPVLRGHINLYPIEVDSTLPSGGAPRWWETLSGEVTTDEFFGELRTRAGTNGVVQVNHPAESSGMLGIANFDPPSGIVGRPDRFSANFDAMEVLNSGHYEEFLEMYLSLISRGHPVTPTGVSDSHGYGNGVGVNLTWVPVGVSAAADLDGNVLASEVKAGHTVVSRGPYIDATIEGVWAPGETVVGSATLDIDVLAPSWIVVDRLLLLRDGVEVERRAWTGEPESFELNPDDDAVYVVIAEGDQSMQPAYNDSPWAMISAIRVDVDGDGWEAPLPPLDLGDGR
jgi:hypothetical protein